MYLGIANKLKQKLIYRAVRDVFCLWLLGRDVNKLAISFNDKYFILKGLFTVWFNKLNNK